MYRKANVLFLMNQTPMHAGSGDSLGIVDMPIQRERHTGFPKIEASSLKGSMREHLENMLVKNKPKEQVRDNLKKINIAFGFDDSEVGEFSKEEIKNLFKKGDKDVSEFAGALGFTDARILLFPVKSMKGVFAWITCPKIISKFNEELKLAGHSVQFDISKGNIAATDNTLTLNGKNIILEEYTFEIDTPNENNTGKNQVNQLGEWLAENVLDRNGYFADKLMTDIVVLENDDFKDFVNLSTEVITRTKINNETGTVQDRALFTEEYLPAESLMYSLALTAPEFTEEKDENKKTFATEQKLNEFFSNFIKNNPVMQIGGNSTLGKGITKTFLINQKNDKNE